MLILLSPAKTLDFVNPAPHFEFTQPEFLDKSAFLINALREKTPEEIAKLMKISATLAALNVERFAAWKRPFSPQNAKAAIFAFMGDVYEGLDAASLSQKEILYLQENLRILSGLYGLLRPLDLIQAYRLEMGLPLQTPQNKNLYDFWGTQIGAHLLQNLPEKEPSAIVNLSSNEYFKALQFPKTTTKVPPKIITPIFEDDKNGQFKIISFYAKKMRGKMARFAAINQLKKIDDLRAFNEDNYRFAKEVSDENRMVFRRKSD